jgi:hypothetical protein
MSDLTYNIQKPSISVLCDILYKLQDKSIPNTTIYVAIGSAAHSVQQDTITKKWSIDPKNEQEFPTFLRSLKTDHLYDPLHIFLIDESLENPPFVVCNDDKQLGRDWVKTNNEYVTSYYNPYTNITVYSFHYNISHPIDKYNYSTYIDSTKFFVELNRLAIEKQWLVVVNDFCGRMMHKFAEYYDKSLIGHKNHIIYGLGMRMDGGCNFDLTMPICDFVFNNNAKSITVFNPFNYEDDYDNLFDTIQVFSHFINSHQYSIIKQQTQMFIKIKKSFLVDCLTSLLRKVYLLKINVDVFWSPVDQHEYLKQVYNINVNIMINNKMYDELICILFKILSEHLIKFVSPLAKDKSKEIVNNVINEIKNTKDPYKWTIIVKKLLDEYEICLN